MEADELPSNEASHVNSRKQGGLTQIKKQHEKLRNITKGHALVY